MAAQRARAFAATSAARVVALYSRSVERAKSLCAETGAQPYDDYEAMLQGVEAVVLCLPNHLHASFARKALEAGKHVLVEYPLCLSAEEAASLARAAERTDRVLMVGNTIIRERMFTYVTERLSRLGGLVSAASRVAFYDAAVAGAWYMDPEKSGSCFAAYSYHHIEYFRRLLGEVTWVLAKDESRPDPARPGCLSLTGGTLVMGHQGGATSCIQWYLSAAGQGLARGFWLTGSEGTLCIVSASGTEDASTALWNGGGGENTERFANEWGVGASCEDFLEAIAGRLDHRARLASDMTTLRVGLAAARSALSGRSESLQGK